MAAPPYMPLYVADYLGDTRCLTTEQHGAYLLLLMALWRAGGRLEAEPRRLARLVGATPARWARLAPEVLDFFQIEDGELTHSRLAAELDKIERAGAQRRAAGARGGAANARRIRGETEAPASPPLEPGPGAAEASQTSESEPESEPDAEQAGAAPNAPAWNRARLDALGADLRAAAGASLDAASPALVNLAPIVALLTPGRGPPAELQADVLPAVRARAARQRPGSIRHWSYFVPAVLDWRDRRLAGAPAPQSPEAFDDRPRSHARAAAPSRADRRALWAEVLADEAGG